MIYCILAKLISSIVAIVWMRINPQSLFLQSFAVGVMPIWAEVIASKWKNIEPAREKNRTWLILDAATDAFAFLIVPAAWWGWILTTPEQVDSLLQSTYTSNMDVLALFLFVACGFYRLFRFLKSGVDTNGYFQGLPVTYTGYLWPMMILSRGMDSTISTGFLVTAGVFMVLPYRFIKASR